MRFNNNKVACNGLRIAIVAAAGWSIVGCGSSSQTGNDASTTGAGGRGGAAVAGTTGRGGAAGTGTGTAGTGAGGAVASVDLGKACTAATDCTGGLTCLKATDKIIYGTEGPANGYCTKTCAADADCTASGGICLNVSSTGATAVNYCFQTCTFGGPMGTSKCHGRMDVGCVTIQVADANTTPPTPQVDICYPVCSQDSDCPAGRKCDLGSSQCADTAPAGDPLGAHCVSDPDAGTSNCAGGCLPIGSGAGGTAIAASVCSMSCVVGNLNACNWVGAGVSLSGGGTHGVCGLAASNAQAGDLGYCVQLCDAVADCTDKTDPGGTCDTSAMSAIGHGFCSF